MSEVAPITCVLDASTLLAFLFNEPGGDVVAGVLADAAISSVNWAETLQKVLSHGGDTSLTRQDLLALRLRIVPFTEDDAEAAALLWAGTRALGLGLGDRACLALGQRLGVPVWTADRTWADLSVGVAVRLLR